MESRAHDGGLRIGEIPAEIRAAQCRKEHKDRRYSCAQSDEQPAEQFSPRSLSPGHLQIYYLQLFCDGFQVVGFGLINSLSQQNAHRRFKYLG